MMSSLFRVVAFIFVSIFFCISGAQIPSKTPEGPKVVSTSIHHIQKCFPILFKFRKPTEFKSLKDVQAEVERAFTFKTKIEKQRDVLFKDLDTNKRLRLSYTGNPKKPLVELAKLDAEGVATPLVHKPLKPLNDWDGLTSEVIGAQAAERIDKEFDVKTTQGPVIKYSTQNERVVLLDIDDAASRKSLKCDGEESHFICRCSAK